MAPRLYTQTLPAAAGARWVGVGQEWRRASTPKPSPLAGCFLGGRSPPKPSRGRAMFTSESATPLAFVYSFPIRWPISPLRPRKPIPEQVKPVAGLRPPQPSPRAGWFLGGGRGAAAPRPYAQTLPRAGYVHLSMAHRTATAATLRRRRLPARSDYAHRSRPPLATSRCQERR